MSKEHPATQIRSVARAVQILLHLAQRGQPATAKETATALGLHVATTYHLLNTLVVEGMLTKDSSRRYQLGPNVGVLSDAFERQLSPPADLLSGLRRLAETSGETAYLSAWRQGDIVVLDSIEGSHAVRVGGLHRGTGGDAHARASGKLLLAHASPDTRESYLSSRELRAVTDHTITDAVQLEEEFNRIRDRGYSADEGEFLEGVACLSAPIFGSGVVIGAYTVSVPVARFTDSRQALVDAVVGAAGAVST
jgi:IclR family transcriptional regulator, acetate operon repressor